MSLPSNCLTMSIESGLYAGSSHEFAPGRYTIGSSVDADIVLMEADVEPLHAVIDTSRPELQVEALAAKVSVDAQKHLATGARQIVATPLRLNIGAVQLHFSRAGDSSPQSRDSGLFGASMPRSRLLMGAALVSIVSIALMMHSLADVPISQTTGAFRGDVRQLLLASTANMPDILPVVAREAMPREREVGLSVPDLASDKVKAAADAMRAEVERMGILNVLIEPGVGIVAATGTIDPKAAAQWQTVQRWFDERFEGDITLVNGVSVKAEKVPVSLSIEGVWRGDHPHLMIRGQKYLEGAMLDGGWAIERIEAEKVLLRREGKLVAVRY
jgi:Inner membrane component of T3SS, cytoplasmic domain